MKYDEIQEEKERKKGEWYFIVTNLEKKRKIKEAEDLRGGGKKKR